MKVSVRPVPLALFVLVSFLFQTELASSTDDLDKWIGQMLLVGFRGTELDGDEPVLQDIRELGIGGVVLFSYDVPAHSPVRNISSPPQVRSLIRTLQENSSIPLFVGIDQD